MYIIHSNERAVKPERFQITYQKSYQKYMDNKRIKNETNGFYFSNSHFVYGIMYSSYRNVRENFDK